MLTIFFKSHQMQRTTRKISTFHITKRMPDTLTGESGIFALHEPLHLV